MTKTRNELLQEIEDLIESGGGGGRTDYGALTNAAILAIPSPDELGQAFSTDTYSNYTYYSGSWYSTAGVVLV